MTHLFGKTTGLGTLRNFRLRNAYDHRDDPSAWYNIRCIHHSYNLHLHTGSHPLYPSLWCLDTGTQAGGVAGTRPRAHTPTRTHAHTHTRTHAHTHTRTHAHTHTRTHAHTHTRTHAHTHTRTYTPMNENTMGILKKKL